MLTLGMLLCIITNDVSVCVLCEDLLLFKSPVWILFQCIHTLVLVLQSINSDSDQKIFMQFLPASSLNMGFFFPPKPLWSSAQTQFAQVFAWGHKKQAQPYVYPIPAFAYSSTATAAMSLKNTESTGLNWPQLESCVTEGNYGSTDLLLCWICWVFRENAPWFNAPSWAVIYCWLCLVGRVRWCTERLSHWFSHCKKCLTLQVFKCKRSMY